MTIIEMIALAAALSIDSLAVSMSGSVSLVASSAGRRNSCGAGKGFLGSRGLPPGKVAFVVLVLSVVQTLFFAGGYFAGDAVGRFISKWGPYIGFGLLLYVGGDMLVEAVRGCDEQARDFSAVWKIMLAAVATSIDAVAVGASFGLSALPLSELVETAAATFIATALFALAGMLCGSGIGCRFGRPAKAAAGIVLIAIGVGLLL